MPVDRSWRRPAAIRCRSALRRHRHERAATAQLRGVGLQTWYRWTYADVQPMVTIDDIREVVRDLPRSYEALVRDRVKFRVGRIVYLAFSRDERVMGFAFPKEERDALVESDPAKFLLPRASDLRYN